MSHSLLRLTVVCLSVLLLLLTSVAAAAAMTFDEAIDELVISDYAKDGVTYLTSLGSNDLGFRLTGTIPERDAARYIMDEMRAAGLTDVHREAVPVDAFTLKGASLTVDDREMVASQFPGIPGTPSAGLTAPIVYVHGGLASDYEGLDVKGKIVLVDYDQKLWRRMCGAEATAHGAIGVIATFGPNTAPYGTAAADALLSWDGEYDMSWAPMVYLSRQDGEWLKARLSDGGTVVGTLRSEAGVRMAEQGGKGYNLLGMIPGRNPTAPAVLVTAHYDAHFRAAADDTGGVMNMLQIAKAMKMSGYQPQRPIIFMFVTAEEYGYTNSHYDYLIGAWHALTRRHTDWPGRIAVNLNLENMAQKGTSLLVLQPRDVALKPWLQSMQAANNGLLPYGSLYYTSPATTDDGWTIAASGVPSVTFAAGDMIKFYATYHTQYDTIDLVDFTMLGQCAKFIQRTIVSVDSGLLPHSLKARADNLAAAVNADQLLIAGVPAKSVHTLQDRIAVFQEATQAFEDGRDGLTGGDVGRANLGLLKLEKKALRSFIAWDCDDNGIYPHQQILKNTLALNDTIRELEKDSPDVPTALVSLVKVDRTKTGVVMSPWTYSEELWQRDPANPRLFWGEQGKLVKWLNVMPQYRQIQAGNGKYAIPALLSMREAQRVELTKRVDRLSAVLDSLTEGVRELPQ